MVDLENSGSLENEVEKHLEASSRILSHGLLLENMKKLKMLYVLSALLDIAGYVIRTIG